MILTLEVRRSLTKAAVEREPVKKKEKEYKNAIDTPSLSCELSSERLASDVDAPTYTNLSRLFRELLFSVRRHKIECTSVHGRAISRSLLYAGLFHARFSRSTLLAPCSSTPGMFYPVDDVYPECILVCKSHEGGTRLYRELLSSRLSMRNMVTNTK